MSSSQLKPYRWRGDVKWTTCQRLFHADSNLYLRAWIQRAIHCATLLWQWWFDGKLHFEPDHHHRHGHRNRHHHEHHHHHHHHHSHHHHHLTVFVCHFIYIFISVWHIYHSLYWSPVIATWPVAFLSFVIITQPSEIGLYNRLTVYLHVLDQASSENVGQEGHPP